MDTLHRIAICLLKPFIHRIVLTILLFGIRGFASGLYQAMGLYTPEVIYIFQYDNSTL